MKKKKLVSRQNERSSTKQSQTDNKYYDLNEYNLILYVFCIHSKRVLRKKSALSKWTKSNQSENSKRIANK